jgi:hypothetical protein
MRLGANSKRTTSLTPDKVCGVSEEAYYKTTSSDPTRHHRNLPRHQNENRFIF